MKPPATRMQHLTPHFFAALGPRLAAMQAAGIDVIKLDEGSPDLPPAAHIIEALACAAARPDRHGYQSHKGPLALRLAWAEMYARVYGVMLDPEREIVPLLGSKEGIFHLMAALIEPGDIVLAPDPGYVTYTRGALFSGGEAYPMPLLPERDYLPDLEAIPGEVLARAKILWLNYPNNPTAALATPAFFAQAVAFARRHNLLLCHDAAYAQVTFNGAAAASLLQAPGAKDVAIEFNTLSKSHNMAGWRVGAAVGNPEVLRILFTLKTNLDSSHFLPVLEAAVAAMRGDQVWLEERNAVYRRRRDAVLAGLHALGLAARPPQGSLYVWSPIPAGWSAAGFTTVLLEEAHVSLTPGSFFGQHGEGYVRIALTEPLERIELAMQRIAAALPRLIETGDPTGDFATDRERSSG